jgi:hypothetical protein
MRRRIVAAHLDDGVAVPIHHYRGNCIGFRRAGLDRRFGNRHSGAQ